MKGIKFLAAGAAGIWFAINAVNPGIDAVTWVLIHACGLDWGRAAARAPLVFGVVVGSIGLLAIWVWIVVEEDRSRKRLRKSHRNHARNPEYPTLPEHTDKGA